MLSAGIAGLGGALYGMQLGAISPERFNLVAGLPIFVLVVVGGAGLVGGALFAGISPLRPPAAHVRPRRRPSTKINTVTPGLTGIGLGRNPSGVVPLMSEGVAPVRKDRPVLLGMIGAMVAVYVLRRLDVFANWPFVILLVRLPRGRPTPSPSGGSSARARAAGRGRRGGGRSTSSGSGSRRRGPPIGWPRWTRRSSSTASPPRWPPTGRMPVPALEVRRGHGPLRRQPRARRRLALGRGRPGHRAHRAERRRQDHAVQRHHRAAHADVRPDR